MRQKLLKRSYTIKEKQRISEVAGMSYDESVTRRSFLKSLALAAGATACLGMSARPTFAEEDYEVIGWSQWGLPLVVHHLGNGPIKLFLLGGQHGGPEANTTDLVHLIRDHLLANPGEVPANVTVYMMPEGNPDGLAAGTRQYISGVDPNRNWATPDWQPDAYDSWGRFRYGLGGTAPFSEPETTALGNWLWRVWPNYIINYHSAGGFMFGGGGSGLSGELNALYAQASGYWRPTGGGGGGGSPLGYRATGNMNGWTRSVGMSGCLIELTSAWDPEFGRNFEGVRAVLARLGAESPPQ